MFATNTRFHFSHSLLRIRGTLASHQRICLGHAREGNISGQRGEDSSSFTSVFFHRRHERRCGKRRQGHRRTYWRRSLTRLALRLFVLRLLTLRLFTLVPVCQLSRIVKTLLDLDLLLRVLPHEVDSDHAVAIRVQRITDSRVSYHSLVAFQLKLVNRVALGCFGHVTLVQDKANRLPFFGDDRRLFGEGQAVRVSDQNGEIVAVGLATHLQVDVLSSLPHAQVPVRLDVQRVVVRANDGLNRLRLGLLFLDDRRRQVESNSEWNGGVKRIVGARRRGW